MSQRNALNKQITLTGVSDGGRLSRTFQIQRKIREGASVICYEATHEASGRGILRTPEGEREVRAGELIFFPAGEEGAHKLTNASETENLQYIDFDVSHDLDVAVYPDSDKIGVWGMGINQIFPKSADVDYYDGE